MECNKDEAARAKSLAEAKLQNKDFIGAKKFALKAQSLYPGLDGISQMLTTIGMYISAENRINGQVNWYEVLGVAPTADEENIKKQYRKLALMLHPDKNKSAGAEGAFKLLSEASTLLMDKDKRLAYDVFTGLNGLQQTVPTNTSRPRPSPTNVFPTSTPRPNPSNVPHGSTFTHHWGPPNPSTARPNPFTYPCGPQNPSTVRPNSSNVHTGSPFTYPFGPPNHTGSSSTCPSGSSGISSEPSFSKCTKGKSSAPKPRKKAAKAAPPKPSPSTAPSPAPAPAPSTAPAPMNQTAVSFWTMCSQCKVHYEYHNMYRDITLLCPNCKSPFLASEMPQPVSKSKLPKPSPKVPVQQRQCGNNNVSNSGARLSVNNDQGKNVNVVPDAQKPVVGLNNVVSDAQKPGVGLKNVVSDAQKPGVGLKNVVSDAQKPGVGLNNVVSDAQKPVVGLKNVVSDAQKPGVGLKNVVSDAQKPGLGSKNVVSDAKNPGLGKMGSKNRMHTQRPPSSASTNVNSAGSFVGAKVTSMEDKVMRNVHTKSNASMDGFKKRKLDSQNGGAYRKNYNSNDKIPEGRNGNSGTTWKKLGVKASRELTNPETRGMLMRKAREEISKKFEEQSPEIPMDNNVSSNNNKQKDRKAEKRRADPADNIEKDRKPEKTNGKIQKKENEDSFAEINNTPAMSVQDPDFYDFDKDRSENSFAANEVWATYDDDDGMPRSYAMIHEVISKKPFCLKISWLNSKTATEFSSTLDWAGVGFYKTCGEFRIGKHEFCEFVNAFSQKVKWAKGRRGSVLIFPQKGDVWALYRNWSPDWDTTTSDDVIHKYDMVVVLEDYNEEKGFVSVAPLVKVVGYKTVFCQDIRKEAVVEIKKGEMFRFSHRVPHHILTSQEAPGTPAGCLELDPAATPLELLGIGEGSDVNNSVGENQTC